MNRLSGSNPSSLAVPAGAIPAQGPPQDTVLRHLAHARAATQQGGSGSNTEMRALLRKERELERVRASSSLSNRENEPPPRRVANTASSMTASLSDRKLSQNSSNSSLATGSIQSANDGLEAPPPQPQQPPSSSSAAVSSRWTGHSRRPSNTKGTLPVTAGPAGPTGVSSLPRQSLASDKEGSVSSSSSRIPAPPESFDHSFGVDALQAAFSAKYYELANKCKNWERYAAKLRAQNEVVEVENRVLREQIARLEADNAALRHEQQQRDHASYRREVESRLSCFEDRLPAHTQSGDNLGDRFHSGETLIDLDHISAPSAPSSASKSSDGRRPCQVTYCSSNLQSEDRPELRPPTPVSALSLPTMLPSVPRPQESDYQVAAPGRRSLNHYSAEDFHEWPVNSKRDSASLAEIINQDAANRDFGALYGEGRSSRLGSRRIESDASTAGGGARSAVLPTSATSPPGPYSAVDDPSALTSHALAAMNRQHAAMVGGEQPTSGRTTAQGHLRPTQGKRRSTISVDRTLEFGLHHSHMAGLSTYQAAATQASAGADARSRGPSIVSEAATVTGEYLQEYVEQRRQQRKTSFTAQQQHQHSQQPGSRPASRLSNHSAGGDRTRRARSRAGSVHDAIPMLKDDVFSDGAVAVVSGGPPSRPSGTSPLVENVNVVNAASLYATSGLGLNSPSPQAKQRSALMELRGSQLMMPSDTSQSSQSLHSGIADYSNSSTELSDGAEDQRRAHRALYASLRAELDTEDLVKFEKYVHRYDALEIGLDGPRGLINRVKKLLLLTDPDLKAKPEKLRVRKELAREFEKVVKNTAT